MLRLGPVVEHMAVYEPLCSNANLHVDGQPTEHG